MNAQTKTAKVYEAIAAVTEDISKEGIAKARSNQQQGYKFRGIDDVYNALSPFLAKHRLCILPRVLARTVTERATAKGGVLFYTTVEVEFDFVAAEDGSIHVVKTFGEAMDSADKSTNKAMSAAYKYATMQAFCIPTEGDNDADAHTHEVAAQNGGALKQQLQESVKQIEPITNDQRDIIQTLAPAAGKSTQDICGAYRVSSLKDLTHTQAENIIKRLRDNAKEPANA